jgi:hypothetical protein
MTLALTASEAIWSLLGLVCLGVIYLAIAVSKLRERVARLDGKLEQRERDNGR